MSHTLAKIRMNSGPHQDGFEEELLSAYLDDELNSEERAAVERRLESDPAATERLQELRRLSSIVRRLPSQQLPQSIRDRVVEAITPGVDKRIADDGSSDVAGRPWWSRPGVRRGIVWATAAIAASMLLSVVMPEDREDAGDQRQLAKRDSDTDRGEAGFGAAADASTQGDARLGAALERPEQPQTRGIVPEADQLAWSAAESPLTDANEPLDSQLIQQSVTKSERQLEQETEVESFDPPQESENRSALSTLAIDEPLSESTQSARDAELPTPSRRTAAPPELARQTQLSFSQLPSTARRDQAQSTQRIFRITGRSAGQMAQDLKQRLAAAGVETQDPVDAPTENARFGGRQLQAPQDGETYFVVHAKPSQILQVVEECIGEPAMYQSVRYVLAGAAARQAEGSAGATDQSKEPVLHEQPDTLRLSELAVQLSAAGGEPRTRRLEPQVDRSWTARVDRPSASIGGAASNDQPTNAEAFKPESEQYAFRIVDEAVAEKLVDSGAAPSAQRREALDQERITVIFAIESQGN